MSDQLDVIFDRRAQALLAALTAVPPLAATVAAWWLLGPQIHQDSLSRAIPLCIGAAVGGVAIAAWTARLIPASWYVDKLTHRELRDMAWLAIAVVAIGAALITDSTLLFVLACAAGFGSWATQSFILRDQHGRPQRSATGVRADP